MIHPTRPIARGLAPDRCRPDDRRGCPEPADDAALFAAMLQFGAAGAAAAAAAVAGGHQWPPPDQTQGSGEK